ncbi:MAG: hypothetical protein WC682_04845 [Parcubacteria group bacterium]|jgi:cell division protein FtsB
MIRIKMIVKTEIGVSIILVFSLLVAIFTVVGFGKTIKDLDRINESVQKNQAALNELPKNEQGTPVISH